MTGTDPGCVAAGFSVVELDAMAWSGDDTAGCLIVAVTQFPRPSPAQESLPSLPGILGCLQRPEDVMEWASILANTR